MGEGPILNRGVKGVNGLNPCEAGDIQLWATVGEPRSVNRSLVYDHSGGRRLVASSAFDDPQWNI